MSRKPTRPPKKRPHTREGADHAAAGEGASDEPIQASEPPKGEDGGVPEGGGKKTLPAFGFAADLLRKDDPVAATEDAVAATEDAVAATEDADRPTSSAPEVETTDQPHTVGEDSTTAADRIFRFADSLEQEAEEQERVAQRIATWVAFELASETFALPVEPVREVLRVSGITRVPHAPKPIRGVTNLRGRVIPVIDLRLRIDLPPTPIDRSTRIIVVASRKRLLGLLVDAVQQVIHLDLNQVQPPPEDVMTLQSDYISGVYHLADKLVLLLDVDRALIVRDEPQESARAQGSGAA